MTSAPANAGAWDSRACTLQEADQSTGRKARPGIALPITERNTVNWFLDIREYPVAEGEMGKAYPDMCEAETPREAIEKYMRRHIAKKFTWIAAHDSFNAIDRCHHCFARWTSNFVRLARNVKLGPPDADGKRYYVVTRQHVVSPHLVIVDGEQVEIDSPFDGVYWVRKAEAASL